MTNPSPIQPVRKRLSWKRGYTIALITVLGLLVHLWAGWQLPVDYDEPVYLNAGSDYGRLIRAGDFQGFLSYDENSEHPALVKLLYGIPVLLQGERTSSESIFYFGRLLNVLFGTLTILLAALINPLAGVFLALDTLFIKYTSQAYLEALPQLAALISVVTLLKARRGRDAWFWISAFSLGILAAGKFAYLPVVVVLLYVAIWEKKFHWFDISFFFLVSIVFFLALNPALWNNPLGLLRDSISYHFTYAQSAHVQQSGFPWYQPFVWLSNTIPWHPQVFIFLGLDGFIFLLGIPGLYWEWKQRRWVFLWFVIGMLALCLWPTKWPQYTLLVIPPLCISAADLTVRAYRFIRGIEKVREWFAESDPRAQNWMFILPLVLAGAFVMIRSLLTIGNAAERQGWYIYSQSDVISSPQSNIMNDLALAGGDSVIIATANGVALWTPMDGRFGDTWTIYDTTNSGLPDNSVNVLLSDEGGGWWFGTNAGLAHLHQGDWDVIRMADIGLTGWRITSLAMDSRDQLWVGTDSGLAVQTPAGWEVFTSETSGLRNNEVTALAVEKSARFDRVWVGTPAGIDAYNFDERTWSHFDQENADVGWGNVTDLMVDSSGKVWVAYFSAGASTWDGLAWTRFTLPDAAIPAGTVQRVFETEPGIYWMSTAQSSSVGRMLITNAGGAWHTLTLRNSGYPGAEASGILVHPRGWLLVASRTDGLVVYKPEFSFTR